MEQKTVLYNGLLCIITAENGEYVTLKEIESGLLHLSIHIKELTYVNT